MTDRDTRAPVWPLRLATREGIRNALLGRWVSALVVVTVSMLITATSFGAAWGASRLVQAETRWWEEGGGILLARATDQDHPVIDATRCDHVNSLPGVVGAYAATTPTGTLSPLPGVRATEIRVSPGVFRFHGIAPPGGPVLLAGASVLENRGISPGTEVVISGGLVAVVEVPDATLPQELAGAWLNPEMVSGSAEHCVVKVEPGYHSGVTRYLETQLASPAGRPAVVLPLLASPRDFVSEYRSRPLAWGWAAAAVLLGGMWALVTWLRRDRVAIHTTFGAHPQARLVIQLAEWTTLTLPALCWGWASAITWSVALGMQPHVALTQVSATAVAAWSGASLIAVAIGLIPVRSLLSALKE